MSAPMTPEPMSDERIAEIRRAWDGVDATSHRLTVTNTRTPGQLLHAQSRASKDVPALLNEVERLHAELALAFSPGMYLDIQKVLDKALGTNEADGAGGGIVADIALVADRMRQAETERDAVRAELATVLNNYAGLQAEAITLEGERDEARIEAGQLRAALAEERARHGELVAEMQRARQAAGDARAELDDTVGEARSDIAGLESLARRYRTAWESARRGRLEARVQIKTARPYIDWLHEQRRALFGRVAEVEAELGKAREQVRVLAGLLKRGNPKVFCAQHPNHAEPGCEVCRDAGIFRSALGEQDGDQTDG